MIKRWMEATDNRDWKEMSEGVSLYNTTSESSRPITSQHPRHSAHVDWIFLQQLGFCKAVRAINHVRVLTTVPAYRCRTTQITAQASSSVLPHIRAISIKSHNADRN